MKFFITPRKNWLVETIEDFRSLNFFERYRQLPTAELAALMNDRFEQEWGKEPDPSRKTSELLLLAYDEDRVWWNDTEADVCSENAVYTQTLREWGTISRGAFLPHDVKEHWETEQGPIEISCALNGRPVKLYPDYREDYIDLNLLPQINKLLEKTNMRFELYEPVDQTGFVVVLTDREKKMLQKKRHWRFAF